MMEEYLVDLPDKWISASLLEEALQNAWSTAHTLPSKETTITLLFPPSCKVMVDAAVRILSLANQLAAADIPVTLAFAGEQHEAMGYLNRAFFFALLSEKVRILPHRPDSTYPERLRGNSSRLVEFKALPSKRNEAVEAIPSQLTDALETTIATLPARQSFEHTPYTPFTELINNVYDHSKTELDDLPRSKFIENKH